MSDRYATRLARALAVVINILDPDVVILGGGMSNVDHLYEEVPKRWGKWIFSDSVATRLARKPARRLGGRGGCGMALAGSLIKGRGKQDPPVGPGTVPTKGEA